MLTESFMKPLRSHFVDSAHAWRAGWSAIFRTHRAFVVTSPAADPNVKQEFRHLMALTMNVGAFYVPTYCFLPSVVMLGTTRQTDGPGPPGNYHPEAAAEARSTDSHRTPLQCILLRS